MDNASVKPTPLQSGDGAGISMHDELFTGSGQMGRLVQTRDWSLTPLGPQHNWPQSLKTALRILLSSRYAMWMGWGEELTFFYNDAYRPTLGIKHPWALGSAARQVWAEIWSDIGPRIEKVLRTGEATYDEGLLLFLERSGFSEETYHTFSYSPLADDSGRVVGMLCVVAEETERVIAERRMALLRELATDLAVTNTEQEVLAAVERRVGHDRKDLPFMLSYLFEAESGGRARLAGTTGLDPALSVVAAAIDPGADDPQWPVEAAWHGTTTTVGDIARRFGNQPPPSAWDRPPLEATIVPLKSQGQEQPAGFLVAGLSPYRRYDDAYAGFIDLLAGQIAAALANARAYEIERRRAAALAELDRAKTTFFSNVSHEFRTPLTLMLGPLEETLAAPEKSIPAKERERLQMIQRNGQRLLKLVNTLLDFSRIEAGRVQANYQPTDLAGFTAELASVFRSAIEAAGLQLAIDCPPLPEPVYVDRDMWEKIVLNLLSNAFKYTFEGQIVVSLAVSGQSAQLSVKDTGIGIAAHELPRLFERFYRVEGARGRTYEGSGIGLALVAELARLHGGTIAVASILGQGSTFTVNLPLGTKHLDSKAVSAPDPLPSTAIRVDAYVEEALSWLSTADNTAAATLSGWLPDRPFESTYHRSRILLADDNADMREYVRRLLGERYTVEVVSDGLEALAAIERELPDLVLTDAMMPRLDGFELLKALRQRRGGVEVPVIVLSARAGEEARIEGLAAGADDYLVKPFSARELLARVQANLALSHVRRETEQRLRKAEQRTRLAIEAARLGTWHYDPSADQGELDSRLCEILGLSSEHARLSLTAALQSVHPDDRQRVGAALAAALDPTGAGRYELEHRIVQPDGGVRWLSVNGLVLFEGEDTARRPVEFFGTALDITERKQGELSLRESEARLVAILDGSGTVVYLKDLEGRLQLVNREFERLFGWPREKAIGKTDRELFGEELAEQFLKNDRQVLEASRPLEFEEVIPLDGEQRTYLSVKFPLYDTSGKVYALCGFSTDITERKRSEKMLEIARAEAETANRVKDEFLAVLSHELRTPLNPIIGWTQLLRRGGLPEKTQASALEAIERNAKLQNQLIADLLDVNRIQRGKFELKLQPLALEGVVQLAVETVRPLAKNAQVELTVEVAKNLPELMADSVRLTQVVWNLLTNAIKFTPAGGQVEVRLMTTAGGVRIEVRDSGVGIAPEFLPRLFERFTQASAGTTRTQGGLGLGLFIVKHIVELHGGRVWAASAGAGSGAAFFVELPLPVPSP
ncbi:ATP-binding protein [Gloeobacter kilaueensis]|uniref:Circadian input-output histidine kinase CikA n=1 Tax=Gloeobacter kilaueensis (strain ATCC BAA-2537 / CCAP 1431/1 / ULC 316 / JS1) TaxID=1183438 RepID=U5QLC3_GLOK1|nr:ATP-binding protein [Gloeobacter kilaueensis]AGY58384.1 multi-sensor hybrid histidine kinase [Gloeobacter kilaueensis JS1]